MDNMFIGQIMLFAGAFAPRGWMACEGQILPISSNQALFSLLGATYGGNGINTFALPDLRGRAAVGAGNTSGIALGKQYGKETVTLEANQLPAHNHDVPAGITVIAKSNNSDDEDSTSPAGKYLRRTPGTSTFSSTANAAMGQTTATVTVAPGNDAAPYRNMQPSLAMTYCIALQGIYPSRN